MTYEPIRLFSHSIEIDILIVYILSELAIDSSIGCSCTHVAMPLLDRCRLDVGRSSHVGRDLL
jgi:hypothetical protein